MFYQRKKKQAQDRTNKMNLSCFRKENQEEFLQKWHLN